MNYYRYRFPPSNDHMEISEREWNHPQTMSPHESLCHMRMNNSQIYPRFPRNIRPYFSNHRREFFPFNNTRFPRMPNHFRMPHSTFDWNMQSENNPDYEVHCGTNGGSHMHPFNIQHRFNNQYKYNGNKESLVQNAHKESFIKRYQESTGNDWQRESQYSEMKNMETSHMHPNWENNNIELRNDGLCDQYKIIQTPELEETKISSTIYNNIDSSYMEAKEVEDITHAQEHVVFGDPDLSNISADTQTITFNDLSREDNSSEHIVSSDPNIQDENTEENEKILEDIEKVLNSTDENSLAVYFLNSLYPTLESENAFTQLLPKDNTAVLDGCNLNPLEQTGVNSPEIREHEINLDSTKCETSPNNADCNFILDFNQISETENKNTKCKDYSEKYDQNGIQSKFSDFSSNNGREDCNKNNEKEKAICIFDDSELNHCENTEKYPDCNVKKDLEGLLDRKTMEQKFIFHAPIINISQQNQISADKGELSFNTSNDNIYSDIKNSLLKNPQITSVENLFAKKSNNHDSNVSKNECEINSILNYIIQLSEMHPTLPVNRSEKKTAEQNLDYLVNENSSCNGNGCETKMTSRDGVSTEDTLSDQNTVDKLKSPIKASTIHPSSETFSNVQVSPKDSISTLRSLNRQSVVKSPLNNEACLLASSTGDKTIQSCPIDPSSFVLWPEESDFVYSNVLDTEILSSHMETSLSSITNYMLDEPTDTSFNDAKGTFVINECNYPLNSDATENKTPKCSRKKKKKRRVRNIGTEMRLTGFDNARLRSDAIDISLTLPDNIFELDAVYWLDLDKAQMTKRKDYKRYRNSSKWKRRKSGRIKRDAASPSESSYHEKLNNENSINSLKKSLKKICCDAATQTLTTGTSSGKFVRNKYAQTQFNNSDMCLQKAIEKNSSQSENSENKYHLRSFTTYNKNVVRDNQRKRFRSKSEETVREYRTRSTIRTKETNINSVVEMRNSTFNPKSGIKRDKKLSQCDKFTAEANISKTISNSSEKLVLSSRSNTSLNSLKLSSREKNEVSEASDKRTAMSNKLENQFIPKGEGTYKNISKHELTRKPSCAIKNSEYKCKKRKASYSTRQRNVSSTSPQVKKIKPNISIDKTIYLRSSKKKI